MIDILFPRSPAANLEPLLARLRAAPGRAPFEATAMGFVEALSRALLDDRTLDPTGALIALGHWFRPAHLSALRERLAPSGLPGESRALRRGLVFHLAPSNVDTLPLYCWLLSLLCGNANIVRVSRRRVAELSAFFDRVAPILQQAEYRDLAESSLILTYDHDEALTEQLSAHCDLRLIWGSDEVVSQLRRIPLPALASELVFPNRFSLAMVRADALLEVPEQDLKALAEGFCRDIFIFDQQACASPRALVWIGENATCTQARARFWPAVAAELEGRFPDHQTLQVMDRLTTLFRLLAAQPGARADRPLGALPTRVWLPNLGTVERRLHAGHGVLIELDRTDLRAALCLLQSSDQTIGYFGYEREELLELLPCVPPHAADRLVPIGSAMQFSPVWDGIDLVRTLTRSPFLV